MPRQSVQTQDNLGEAIICTIGCDNNRFFLLDSDFFFTEKTFFAINVKMKMHPNPRKKRDL